MTDFAAPLNEQVRARLVPISRDYFHDPEYFRGKLPPGAQFLPDPTHQCPVFMAEGVMSAAQCDRIALTLRDSAVSSVARAVGYGVRKATQYTLVDEVMSEYRLAMSCVDQRIEQFYAVRLSELVLPHALGYVAGDRYGVHADNCEPVIDAAGNLLHMKLIAPEREFSTILFLSDSVTGPGGENECIGGELSFPFIIDRAGRRLVVIPRKGLLVAFPSNPYFAHEIHEIKAGFRMAIVDWRSSR